MGAQQEYKGSTSGYEGLEGSASNQSDNPYANAQQSFSWKGGKCKKAQYIGRVTIGTEFIVEFELTVHGKTGTSWESILHVGHLDMERSPGIWFHPKSLKLHVRLSDVYDKNKGYDPAMELEKNTKYNLKLQCIDSMVSLFINGKMKSSAGDIVHLTRFLAPIWCGDPWYNAANATVRNLRIYAPKQAVIEAPAPSLHVITVLAIDHAHGANVNGKYFHFDKKDIDSYLLRPLKDNERFKIRVKRTNYVGSVIMWPQGNGGSRGNAHGRFDKDPIGAGIGYFKINDQIEILSVL